MSVTIRSVGNPSSTALGVMPPRNTPTISASAIDRMPTLIVVVQLSVTARTSAPTEIHARLIGGAAAIGAAVRGEHAHELADVGAGPPATRPSRTSPPTPSARQHERRAVAELLEAAPRA